MSYANQMNGDKLMGQGNLHGKALQHFDARYPKHTCVMVEKIHVILRAMLNK